MKRALLFGGVPVIAGIALIVLWALADAAASRGNDWTQVLATIESARAQEGALQIAYRYEHGGRQYRNPAGHLTLREGTHAGSIATRYAAGRQILAYVNPSAPPESILEPQPRPSPVNLIAGVVLLIIGLPIGGYLFLQKPARKNNNNKNRKRARKPSAPLSRLKPPPSVPRK